MIGRHAHHALWGAVTVLLLASATRYRATMRHLSAATNLESPTTEPTLPGWPTQDSLLEAAAIATEANPFRPDRAAAAVDHNTNDVVRLPVAIGANPVLRGIVGGPPWSAIVLGLPNTQGAVVLRMGDTVSGFSIVRIRRDTVVLRNAAVMYTLLPTAP